MSQNLEEYKYRPGAGFIVGCISFFLASGILFFPIDSFVARAVVLTGFFILCALPTIMAMSLATLIGLSLHYAAIRRVWNTRLIHLSALLTPSTVLIAGVIRGILAGGFSDFEGSPLELVFFVSAVPGYQAYPLVFALIFAALHWPDRASAVTSNGQPTPLA